MKQFGVVGLGVMGENLALNIERNGFPVAVYNRSYDKTDAFLKERGAYLHYSEEDLQKDIETFRRLSSR